MEPSDHFLHRDSNQEQVVTATSAPQWMTVSEAASHLRVHTGTLLKWARENRVKAYALSGTKRRSWRFRRDELDSALSPQTVAPEIASTLNIGNRKRVRFQRGSVVLDRRKNTWHYLWRDGGTRHSKLIGTKAKFPSKSAAWIAAEAFRLREPVATEGTKQQTSAPTVRLLTEGYRSERMPTRIDTRRSYEVWLKHYILPKFGDEPITSVDARTVELWFGGLKLSPKSKVHIRGLLHLLWDYAQWRGDVPPQRNPMELVSIKGASKRVRPPRCLTAEQFRRFAAALDEPFRLIALLSVSLGLRISEALALKWADIDKTGSIHIERAIVSQNVDDVKSTRSKRVLPLDNVLLKLIEKHRRTSDYTDANDWVFASPFQEGRLPWSYDQIWRVYQSAARTAGIGALGTHSLRHTYRSWLDAVGTSIAVQQKLMRHADIRTTMNVYGDVVTDEMQVANKKVLRLALSDSSKSKSAGTEIRFLYRARKELTC